MISQHHDLFARHRPHEPLERAGADGARIRERLRRVPLDDIATTIISYEEQMRGWTARISQAATGKSQMTAYRELKRQLRNYCAIAVLDYDENAAEQFERLRAAKIRIGTMDLKIAAIAIVNDATLLTRNVSDFAKVPTLKAEDWSL